MDFETLARGLNCTPPAIDDFPKDFFSEKQRQDGAVIVHILVSLYLFVALAVVCDKYFVPAVDKICQALNMSVDVAGATFMAAATSAPELFVNVIGTFITEGDIGVGTIVGSAVFNILAVAACCGIGAGMCGAKVVPLDWWPLTRDCLAYGITVSILICIIHDERVEWYEALCLVLLYIVYIFIMYFDKSIQKFVRGRLEYIRTKKAQNKEKASCKSTDILETHLHLQLPDENGKEDTDSKDNNIEIDQDKLANRNNDHAKSADKDNNILFIDQNSETPVPAHVNGSIKNPVTAEVADVAEANNKTEESKSVGGDEEPHSLWKWPTGSGIFRKITWVITWPIYLVFLFTIPDCERPRFKKWFPLTFFMCIVWIGSLSYVVAWMITIIGDTLKIPDSVMGITFLAAGTSIPEAVSSVIVAKQGHGSMGISNSIGSNTFDILLCLGLPWFIKATFMPTIAGKQWPRCSLDERVFGKRCSAGLQSDHEGVRSLNSTG
ncbi:unnamed protein product [Phaedon cochleariae]|uniref:Sodium/potassium/calcium exchanger 5 n=1 Tax=Phaedon cochleariae TaxID=80249 RepID=A0A9N9X5P2_PHACE|nr:unnamed protein product [Phaedon cochleariae]